MIRDDHDMQRLGTNPQLGIPFDLGIGRVEGSPVHQALVCLLACDDM